MKKKKVFVAGGTGFLGKKIVALLKKRNYPVVHASLQTGIDFRNFQQTLSYFKKHKPDVVLHAAAFIGGIKFGLDHMGEIYYNNILISTHLMEAARLTKVKQFISPIANCAYPDVVKKKFKEDEFWDGPLNPTVMVYGMVRKAQWAQSYAYEKQYNMEFINLVLPNMYGPGDYFEEERSHALGALLMKIVKAKRNKEKRVTIWGTGKPVREWLYIEDGAEAMIRAMDINYTTDPINVGIGKGVSIKELAAIIKKIVGYEGSFVFDETKPDGAAYKVMDIQLCKRIFKWLPKTDLQDGIAQTYTWYKKQTGYEI